MSELACWYDNEEGDFRRSIYRGERPRESEKDRPGRWQETDGQIRFEEGREGNHETETEERTSRPMEEAFVSYVYAQRWLDQGTDTSIHCNTPPILRFNVSLSLTALSLPLSLHLSVSSFRGSRPQIDMRDRTEENDVRHHVTCARETGSRSGRLFVARVDRAERALSNPTV